jgi:DNA invertase Pin-like site-specific DNA recombinase
LRKEILIDKTRMDMRDQPDLQFETIDRSMDHISVVIYAARSKKGDDDRSTDSQRADVRARVVRETPTRLVQGEFTDDGFSGSKRNRGPGLKAAIEAALAAAAEHGACELWAFHSSRFGRGTGKLGEARALGGLFYDLRAQGVALRTVEDDDFVTNEMLIGFASRQAGKYAEDLSAHVRRGKRAQFERGERLGGPVPDGLLRVVELDKSGKASASYERDPARAPIVERAFGLAADGHGDPTIAKRLNTDGHRTKAGGTWTRRRVQSLLTNPTYAARVVMHGGTADQRITNATNVTALIDPTRFDAIQAARPTRDRGGRPQPTGRPTVRYVLSRLARCGRCGSTMYCQTSPYKRKDGSHARRYVCAQVHSQTGTCDAPHIDAAKVDTAIVAHLRTLFVDFTAWTGTLEEARSAERDGLARQLDEARRRLAKLERAETAAHDKLVDALAADSKRADTYADALERVKAERGQLAASVEDVEHVLNARSAEPLPMDAMLDFWSQLGRAVKDGVDGGRSVEEVNLRLRDIFEHFRLDVVDEGVVGVLPVLAPSAVERFGSDRLIVLSGDDVTYTANPAPSAESPIVLFATGAESIRPPVKPVEVPYRNVSNAQVCSRFERPAIGAAARHRAAQGCHGRRALAGRDHSGSARTASASLRGARRSPSALRAARWSLSRRSQLRRSVSAQRSRRAGSVAVSHSFMYSRASRRRSECGSARHVARHRCMTARAASSDSADAKSPIQ